MERFQPGVLAALLAAACTSAEPAPVSTSSYAGHGASAMQEDRDYGPTAEAIGRVLVDASNDGGAWWAPQGPVKDPDEPHQGTALVEWMRARGLEVEELVRDDAVDAERLAAHELVIRANEYATPAPAVLAAYERYVRDGGHLLLLSDYFRPGESDRLAARFDLRLEGTTRGPQRIEFEADPLTEGMVSGRDAWIVGSGAFELPEGTRVLARLDADSYVDLDGDEVRDEQEPMAPIVFGAFSWGEGMVVFATDTNYLELVPQPLVEKLFGALVPSLEH